MKVGFLSVGRRSVDEREAEILLFDNGHTADIFMTVAPDGIDGALQKLREACDAIVIEGDTNAFFTAYADSLSTQPDHFELNGKLHSVVKAATPEFIAERFIPIINKQSKKRFGVIVFKTYGKTPDELKQILKEYMTKKSKVKIGFFPELNECEVHARCPATMAKEDMSTLSYKLDELLGKYTYAYERISITERVSQLLRYDGLKLKVAESFTGGAIAAAFTELAGASEFLMEDIVAYSIASKNKRLYVPLDVIAERGAVSGDTAYGMALGLMQSGDCDLAVATTGNAGPSAQNGEVGLCYIAVGDSSSNSVGVFKYIFGGDRQQNIKSGVKTAMFLLYRAIADRRLRAEKERRERQLRAARLAGQTQKPDTDNKQ